MLMGIKFPLFPFQLRPELSDHATDSDVLGAVINIVKTNMASRSHKLAVHEIVEVNARERVVAVNKEKVQFIVTQVACDPVIGSQGVGISNYDRHLIRPVLKLAISPPRLRHSDTAEIPVRIVQRKLLSRE